MSVSSYEYAILSREAYKIPNYNKVSYGYDLPRGWSYFDSYKTKSKENGCTIVVFKKGKDVVIALKGTNPIDELLERPTEESVNDLVADLLSNIELWLQRKPAQYDIAKNFTKKIIDKALYGSEISFTGHSLGGLLAKLLAVEFKKHATVFDAPGEKELLNRLFPEITKKNIDFIEFASIPNLINTANTHYLESIQMLPFIKVNINKADIKNFVIATKDLHNIDNIVNQFSNKIEDLDKSVSTTNWPSGSKEAYEFFISYEKNKVFWNNFFKNTWQNNVEIQNKYSSISSYQKEFIQKNLDTPSTNILYFLKELDDLEKGNLSLKNSASFKGLIKLILEEETSENEYDFKNLINEFANIANGKIKIEKSNLGKALKKELAFELWGMGTEFLHSLMSNEYDNKFDKKETVGKGSNYDEEF